MSNSQLGGGSLTVVGLSPLITSGAGDAPGDADTTHMPSWGREFRTFTQPVGFLPCSFRVTLWSVTATWQWNVHHLPSDMPSGKKWESKAAGFASGKYHLDMSGRACFLFQYVTQQRGFWWHWWGQSTWCGGTGTQYCGRGGMTESFDVHRLFLKSSSS